MSTRIPEPKPFKTTHSGLLYLDSVLMGLKTDGSCEVQAWGDPLLRVNNHTSSLVEKQSTATFDVPILLEIHRWVSSIWKQIHINIFEMGYNRFSFLLKAISDNNHNLSSIIPQVGSTSGVWRRSNVLRPNPYLCGVDRLFLIDLRLKRNVSEAKLYE